MVADQTTEISASASALHGPNAPRRSRRDQIIFWLGIAYVLIVPSAIGLFTTSASIAWLSLLAGAFVSFLAKFDTIAEFSLGPIKATMRETVAEAAATVTQLRELATSIVSAVLTDLMAGSMMGGMSLQARLKIKEDLESKLRSLDVPDDQVATAVSNWNKGISIFYHSIIVGEMMRLEAGRSRTTAEHNELFNYLNRLSHFPTWEVGEPEEYEARAKERGLLTPAVASLIGDYRYFRTSGLIRHQDDFVRRRESPNS